MKHNLVMQSATLLLFFSIMAVAQATTGDTNAALMAAATATKQPRYNPNHILVRFRTDAAIAAIQVAHATVGAQVVHSYDIVSNLQLVTLPKGTDVRRVVATYRANPSVIYVEPDYEVRTQLTPNDPLFVNGSQWDMLAPGVNRGGIDAVHAWNITTGDNSVVIGVTDTGVDYNHPDLAPNMYALESDCSDGIDNDGNGYVDDCHGINAITGSSDPFDDNKHGTHVSGIIGAQGNNGIGIAGVNWNVGLVACKFLDATGVGYTSGAITCLEYFKDLKDNRGLNLVATNNSWGGGGYSQALYDAIEAHMQSGILFIAAAGNSGLDNDFGGFYPAGYYLPNVISVAATNDLGSLALFSNFGGRTVHLTAPGAQIISTTPNDTYTVLSGTSMAAPHVTGVAALLKAQDHTRDWRAIKNLIFTGGLVAIPGQTTITGSSLNAHGSLTCSNNFVVSRLRPVGSVPVATFGQPVLISALHVNCDASAGTVTATINPGNIVLDLADDGIAPDQVAGDGIYSGFFNPTAAGPYTVDMITTDCPGCVTSFTVNVIQPYFYRPAPGNYVTITGSDLNFHNYSAVARIIPSFPIPFGGGSFSSVYISDSGTISFDTPVATAANSIPLIFNSPLPMSLAGTLVAPFWAWLWPPDSTNNVYYQEVGTPPNRQFVIEWRNLNVCDNLNDGGYGTCTGQLRAEVVFFEAKSDILFNYATVPDIATAPFAAFGSSATIGIQTGVGIANQFGFNAPVLDNNTSLLWTTTGPNQQQPTPSISSISPSSVAVGTAPLLTINGANFASNSVVRWNSVDRETTFINSGQLAIQTTSADVASAGSASLQVFTFAGGLSNAAAFNVLNPPIITSVTNLGVNSVSAGGAGTMLIIDGANFDSGSIVRWNGAARPTQFVTSTNLIVTIGGSDYASPGTAVISIVTGAGLTSPSVNFTITDFKLSHTGPSWVKAGQTATFTVGIQPSPVGFSFDMPITLACTTTFGTCSFTSSSVTPGATGTQTTLNIAASAVRASAPLAHSFGTTMGMLLIPMGGLPVLLVSLRSDKRLRRYRISVKFACLLLGCMLLASCGGGESSGSSPSTNPPSPTQTIVTVNVIAISGTLQHSMSFNFSLQ